ncbi:MAG: TolC family protein [Candidatus Aminicenantes bacterium]|nr:TolC family protein [Candidatus Aminicenantes bacterium]
MKNAKWITAIILIAWVQPLIGQSGESLSLSLEESIIKAIKDNLQVAVEVYNPDMAGVSVQRAKEIFLPQFGLNYANQRNENPSYWWLQGEETVINKQRNFGVSVDQLIPTGGKASLSLSNYKYKTNEAFQLINPRYGSTLQLELTQPLLKNFGFNVTRREIIVAQNNLEISRNQFKTILLDTVYRTQETYWNLVYAIENYKVKQQSLELARDLLNKTSKEVEYGKIAPIEILNAQAVVASREADMLQAEALIRKSEDQLKDLLNIADGEEISPTKIIPTDKPAFDLENIILKEASAIALANRPDLKAREKNIETNELNVSVAKNQMLPGLDLSFSYWSPGISGDRILYQGDNPFTGIIVGKEAGSPSDSLSDAFSFIYNNWSVSLTLSLPLSNFVSKAELIRSKMELEKSFLELKSKKRQVLLETRDAVLDIDTNAKRVEAYRIARELAEERLNAEEKKLAVGLTTNYFVLQYQEELANARSMEIKALIDYKLALAKLDKAMGTSLENRNIKITQFIE